MGDPVAPAFVSRSFDELTVHELHDILRLRSDVFVVEQRCIYADVDGRDVEPGTRHHWFDRGGRPVAYLRTLRRSNGTTQIGRVVTAPDARGQGLAAALVLAVGGEIADPVTLDAQSHLVAWYEHLGYEVAGDEFVEDGIPHVPMRRAGTAD